MVSESWSGPDDSEDEADIGRVEQEQQQLLEAKIRLLEQELELEQQQATVISNGNNNNNNGQDPLAQGGLVKVYKGARLEVWPRQYLKIKKEELLGEGFFGQVANGSLLIKGTKYV